MVTVKHAQSIIEAIKALGLRQATPETLRLVTQHSMSRRGIGVLMRGKSGEILDGRTFQSLQAFGAWSDCDSVLTKSRGDQALVTVKTGLGDRITVVE